MKRKVAATAYASQIDELRRLAREPYERPAALVELRHGIDRERDRSHRQIIETVAREANVNLDPILALARRRNVAKRRQVTRTLKGLERQAAAAAKRTGERFTAVREDYLKTFARPLADASGRTELKFRDPIGRTGQATPGRCPTVFGTSWPFGTPDPGTYEASAVTRRDGRYAWLYPRISNSSGDCDLPEAGVTFQELTYALGPPDANFLVSGVRVDLLAFGIATSVFGDAPGCFGVINPYFEHSFIMLDVYLAQQVNGEWQEWPLVSDKLFEGLGEYVRQVRPMLSGQVYPSSLFVRSPASGGGDLLCHVQVTCSSRSMGEDGRSSISFNSADAHGIFVGGVALLGESV